MEHPRLRRCADEAELIQEQQAFLSRKEAPSVKVVRSRPDPGVRTQADGVRMSLPTGTPVRASEQGPMPQPPQPKRDMVSLDQDMPCVVAETIVERAPAAPAPLRRLAGTAPREGFPRAEHRSVSRFRRSRNLARDIAADPVPVVVAAGATAGAQAMAKRSGKLSAHSGSSDCAGNAAKDEDDAGASVLTAQDRTAIDRENTQRLAAMSADEIAQAKAELANVLSPDLLQLLAARGAAKNAPLPPASAAVSAPPPATVTAAADSVAVDSDEGDEQLEQDKLAWTQDVSVDETVSQAALAGEPGRWRFDLKGTLLASDVSAELPVSAGLHHHGDAPALAGYSLLNVFTLLRSTVPAQRAVAITIVQGVLRRWRHSGRPNATDTAVVATMLQLHLPMYLRVFLDSSHATLLVSTIDTLHALVVAPHWLALMREDAGASLGGAAAVALLPLAPPHAYTAKLNDAEDALTDNELVAADLVRGLLRMRLLPRLRYLLEVAALPRASQAAVLDVLARVAAHSASAAAAVLQTDRLVDVVTHVLEQRVPDAASRAALHLAWVLATASRTAAESLVSQHVLLAAQSYLVVAEAGADASADQLACCAAACSLWAAILRYGIGAVTWLDWSPLLLRVASTASVAQPAALAVMTALVHIAAGAAPSADRHVDAVEWEHVAPLLACARSVLRAPDTRAAAHAAALDMLAAWATHRKPSDAAAWLAELQQLVAASIAPALQHHHVVDAVRHLLACAALPDLPFSPLDLSLPLSTPCVSEESNDCNAATPLLAYRRYARAARVLCAAVHAVTSLLAVHPGLRPALLPPAVVSAWQSLPRSIVRAIPSTLTFSTPALFLLRHAVEAAAALCILLPEHSAAAADGVLARLAPGSELSVQALLQRVCIPDHAPLAAAFADTLLPRKAVQRAQQLAGPQLGVLASLHAPLHVSVLPAGAAWPTLLAAEHFLAGTFDGSPSTEPSPALAAAWLTWLVAESSRVSDTELLRWLLQLHLFTDAVFLDPAVAAAVQAAMPRISAATLPILASSELDPVLGDMTCRSLARLCRRHVFTSSTLDDVLHQFVQASFGAANFAALLTSLLRTCYPIATRHRVLRDLLPLLRVLPPSPTLGDWSEYQPRTGDQAGDARDTAAWLDVLAQACQSPWPGFARAYALHHLACHLWHGDAGVAAGERGHLPKQMAAAIAPALSVADTQDRLLAWPGIDTPLAWFLSPLPSDASCVSQDTLAARRRVLASIGQ